MFIDLRLDTVVDARVFHQQEIEGKLAGAQQPLQKLDQDQKQFQAEHNSKISLASRKVQELNSAVDRLENISAPIEK